MKGLRSEPKEARRGATRDELAPPPKARRGERGRMRMRPPWGRASSGPPPKSKRWIFREVLDENALLGAGETFGGVFGPQPKEVRGCRALLGVEGKWSENIVENKDGHLAVTEQFTGKIKEIRNECKTSERYARSLITLGDKILRAGRLPAIADVALKEIVKELFTLTEMDTRCAIAFLCRVQLNSEYISAEKPIMEHILDGEWGIRRKPAFLAVAKRLIMDLDGENSKKWAQECCNALKISGAELGELVPVVEANAGF